MKKVWIVCPVFNESSCIVPFLIELQTILKTLSTNYRFKILLINDGSQDDTCQKINEYQKQNSDQDIELELLNFARNFGHQAAIVAGLIRAAESKVEAVITMDSDGEHPPHLITSLLSAWEAGSLIVHTRREAHQDLPALKRFLSQCFYRLMNAMGHPIQQGMADFKLWDAGLLNQVQTFLPRCGSTRLFASWLYPNGKVVRYEQKFNSAKVSHFTFRKICSFANRSFFMYSDAPLRLSVGLGTAAIFLSLVYLVYVLVAYATGNTIPGWTSLAVAILFLGGVQIFSIGLLGEYLLQRVFRAQIPLYVVTDKIRPNPDLKR